MLFLLYLSKLFKNSKNKKLIHDIPSRFISDAMLEDIQKTYQKKSLLEHILHRPDSYVGSLARGERSTWVYNISEKKIKEKMISYSPAFYKIYDEILVNALDNKLRHDSTSYIKINVDKDNNSISISNDGPGIPVVMHKEEGLFIPSLIFGHLLTSSNYDDSLSKYTGGRNGFGAKLCNLFSTEFTVETSNAQFGYSFKQTWRDNMTLYSPPIIEPASSLDHTTVTFYPDLSRFHMTSLDDDIISLFHRRAMDVMGCTKNLSVYFNDELIPYKSFKEYVGLYHRQGSEEDKEMVHKVFNDDWEVVVVPSPNDTFNQISFVNGVHTCNGGQHVHYVTDQLTSKLQDMVKRRMKDPSNLIKPIHLKNSFWIFLNCYIRNPTFESQSKEYLTLLPKDFGSQCVLSDDFVKKVAECGILKKLETVLQIKNQELLEKVSGKRKNVIIDIEKLDDAILAGGSRSKECTLILTEGDSAKSLALSGLSVIGRDLYGVYPLKGKLLNVRDTNVKRISQNNEFCNLVKIIGLKYNKRYNSAESLDTLRYGRIMIMADQDPDGSHIKGLLINYLHFYWPELLAQGFLEQFITPLVKAFKNESVETFFSQNQYERWRQRTANSHTWRVKYYKGLGTSTSAEAKEYFANIKRHRIPFICSHDDKTKLKMAFDKKLSDDRKTWLLKWMEQRRENVSGEMVVDDIYPENVSSITVSDFVDKELVQYSNADNERSIPSIMDGLKTGQRKIIYTCLKRNLTKEIKVAQLAGSVSEMSSYHHGESALNDTIVGLAQNYVGSNNINLLEPLGQFGTRVYGGKDAASARYIFTQLTPLTRAIFHPLDDHILSYLSDNTTPIEPEWYAPVIPLILVNGCEGIGTGWRSIIPNFNPLEVIDNLRKLLEDKDSEIMHPWYRGFEGQIEKVSMTQYVCHGRIEKIDSNSFQISELPVKYWTQWYKEKVLNPLSVQNDAGFIRNYEEHSSETSVKIIIHMNPSLTKKAESIGLGKLFKLKNFISTNEMILFDELGRIRKFESAEDILRNFFRVRLSIYDKRKSYMESILSAEYRKSLNQSRFVTDTIQGRISLHNMAESVLEEVLKERGYESDPVREWQKSRKEVIQLSENGEERGEGDGQESFDLRYLINLPLRSLTQERVLLLEKEKKIKYTKLENIQSKTAREIWKEDLDELERRLKKEMHL